MRAAARSVLLHLSAANDPAALGVAQRVLTIPIKKSQQNITHHLSAQNGGPESLRRTSEPRSVAEIESLLLFMVRTGARVSEALRSIPAIFRSRHRGRKCSCAQREKKNKRKERSVPIPMTSSNPCSLRRERLIDRIIVARFFGRYSPGSSHPLRGAHLVGGGRRAGNRKTCQTGPQNHIAPRPLPLFTPSLLCLSCRSIPLITANNSQSCAI